MKVQKIILNLLLFIFTDLLKQYEQTSRDLVKIKTLNYYIKGVKVMRLAYLGIFMLLLLFIFMINGFFAIHLAFFYYMPWSRDVKLLAIFSLGGCYFLIPLGIYIYYASQKKWMRLSKADEFVREAVDSDYEKNE